MPLLPPLDEFPDDDSAGGLSRRLGLTWSMWSGAVLFIPAKARFRSLSLTADSKTQLAKIVILAQRINQQNTQLERASKQGIDLLKHMSVGFYAEHTDKPAIEAIEMSIRRLDGGSENQGSEKTPEAETAVSAYDQFRTWALLWKIEGGGNNDPALPSSNTLPTEMSTALETPIFSNAALLQDLDWDMYSLALPLETSDFAFMLGEHGQ